MFQGGMHPGRSPIPLMVGECDHANRALFWDGDLKKQSFIRVVGLSTPRASRTRPRPSSAPARRLKTSGFPSPRQDPSLAFTPAAENSCSEVGGECTSWGSLHPRGGNERPTTNTRPGREDVERGRVRILEHRLRQLMQENACMRDAMLNKADEVKLERLAEAQRRNQELIAALETTKEGVERITRKPQHGARALQNDLRRKRPQQEPPPVPPQNDTSSPKGRLAESPANAHRPHSAPRVPLRCVEVGTLKPSAIALAREAGSSGDRVITKPDHGKPGGDEEREASSPRKPHPFVAARPEVKAWGSPSPKRRAKAATFPDKPFSSGLLAETRRSSPADGPSTVRPTHVDAAAIDSKNAGDVPSKEKSTTTGGSWKERRQQSSENTDTAAIRKTSGGNDGGRCHNDGSGGPSIHRDTAPKTLLAREAEAAVRRAERAAAAREKEERELRLSSSFRAKELHATSGPDWATIKAHQDIVRKQRTRDRAALLAATSSLPARMARHATMQAVGLDGEGRKRSSSGSDPSNREEGAQGPASTGVKAPQNIGRMMQKRQQRWKRLLAAAKAASRVTVTRPRTPPMEKRRLAQVAKRRAREKAERSARKVAADQRAEDEKRQFQKLIAMYRDSGSTFRETKASVRYAEETRFRIEQDLEQEEQERAAALAEEVRQREVSRAVREYVAASEARRREEHGAGPPLEELIRRKKEEKEAEYRERRRLNRSGLRQALRKRPNLLERQEKYAQQHSKRLAAQASTARDFLESREGFAAAGRRASLEVDGGWMAKAAADDTFTSNEKAELGLPGVVADVSYSRSDTGGIETKTIGVNPRDSSVKDGQHDSPMGDPPAPSSGHDASSPGGITAHETVLPSSKEAEVAVAETEVGGDDSRIGLHGDAESRVQHTGPAAEEAATAGSSGRSEDESAHGDGTSEGDKKQAFEQEDSATGEDIAGHEHPTSGPARRRDDKDGEALETEPEGNAR